MSKATLAVGITLFIMGAVLAAGGYYFIFSNMTIANASVANTTVNISSINTDQLNDGTNVFYLGAFFVILGFIITAASKVTPNKENGKENLDVIFKVPNSYIIAATLFGSLLSIIIVSIIAQALTTYTANNQGVVTSSLIAVAIWMVFVISGLLALYFVFRSKDKFLFILAILFLSLGISFFSLIPLYIFEKHYVKNSKHH